MIAQNISNGRKYFLSFPEFNWHFVKTTPVLADKIFDMAP
jgi:hypothetical protein